MPYMSSGVGPSFFVSVPSVREGWGLVVIEANSVGTPAVGYDVPGIRDSVVDAITGVLADRDEPADLARACLYLIGADEHYAEVRHLAREWAGRYSWDATAACLLARIETSLSPTTSTPSLPVAEPA